MYAFLAATLAAAQTITPATSSPDAVAPAAAIPAPATPLCCTLAKLTPVYLTVTQPVESDKATIGQSFTFKLSHAVSVGDGLIIPAGTPGVGEVIHAAKSRAMGKAGELILAARYLDWNGTRIPLRSFKFGNPFGQDNSDTAMVVGIAVGIAAPFITGGEVRVAAGTDAWAKVAADVTFAPPTLQPAPAPSDVVAPAPTAITQGGK